MKLALGLSSCPNDTFIFHALLHGLTEAPANFDITPRMADVQQLNQMAVAGELPVTKVSVGVMPYILDNYALLSSGSALGWGCGPLVIARTENVDLATARVAIPGRYTTAALLLEMTGIFCGPRVEMRFDRIMPAVAGGDADIGVIIHEGRFTYGNHGLKKLLDLGEWWEKRWNLPLPLGAIAIKRDLGLEAAQEFGKAIARSLEYAWQYPEVSKEYVHAHAQELDAVVTQAHIDTFVTSYTLDLGQKGRQAILELVNAGKKGMDAGPELFADIR